MRYLLLIIGCVAILFPWSVAQAEYEDWSLYTNTEHKFTMRYPSDWWEPCGGNSCSVDFIPPSNPFDDPTWISVIDVGEYDVSFLLERRKTGLQPQTIKEQQRSLVIDGRDAIHHMITAKVGGKTHSSDWKYESVIIPYEDKIFEVVSSSLGYDIFDGFYMSFRRFKDTDIFHDVPIEHEFANAISYIKEKEIIKGYRNGTYRPQNPINRAEFTKIVVGAMNLDLSEEQKNCFPDVQEQWFAEYVCKAKELGIIAGYPDGEFKPGENVNIAEAAKIVAKTFVLASDQRTPHYAKASSGKVESPSTSSGEADQWYEPYISALEDVGALEFEHSDVGRKLTRGEMAEVVYRVMERKK